MERKPTKNKSLWKGMVTKSKEEKLKVVALERARLEQENWRLNCILRSIRHNVNAYNAAVDDQPSPSASTTANLSSLPYLTHPSLTNPSLIHSVTTPNLAAPHPPLVSSSGCSTGTLASLPSSIHPSVTRPNLATPHQQQLVSSAASAPLSTTIGQQKRKRMGLNAAIEDMSPARRVCRSRCPLPDGKKESKAKVGATTAASPCLSLIDATPNHRCGNSSTQVVTPMDCSLVTTKTVTDLEGNQEISSSSPMKTNLSKREFVNAMPNFDRPNAEAGLEKETVNNNISEFATVDNLFDIDSPKVDGQYYQNFSISELLADQLFGGEGFGFPSQPPLDAFASNGSESSDVIAIGELWGWEW